VPSKQEIQNIIDNVTPFQEYVMRGASRMVGQTLDQLESSMPEGKQLEKVKQLVEDILYEYRDALLRATVELDIQNKQK
jgi:hypothetical protein|tara:strand:- start:838 stop:1074 length:237 start_codon:yes stop_codon:yes gene_type:complete